MSLLTGGTGDTVATRRQHARPDQTGRHDTTGDTARTTGGDPDATSAATTGVTTAATTAATTVAGAVATPAGATSSEDVDRSIGQRVVSVLRRIPVLGVIVPLALLGLWQWTSTNGTFSASQLPTPASVLDALDELLERGTFWTHVSITAQRVLTGFAIGAGLGLLVGSVVGLSQTASRLLSPTIRGFRAVPSLAWVPLLVLWMGIDEGPKITLVAIGAFFPVVTTVASGFAHADRKLVEVGRAYGLRGPTLVSGVLLPAASPTIFAGLRLGLAQAWLFVVAAELIASSKGLGFLLIDSQNTSRTDIMVLAIIVLAIAGTTTDLVLSTLERRLLRWV